MIKSCSSFWENNPSNLSDKEVLTRYIQIAQNTAVERIKKDPVRTDFPLGQDLFFFFSVRMTEVFSAVFRIKIFYHSGCKDPSDYTPDIRRRIRSGGSRWGFFCAHCTACQKNPLTDIRCAVHCNVYLFSLIEVLQQLLQYNFNNENVRY